MRLSPRYLICVAEGYPNNARGVLVGLPRRNYRASGVSVDLLLKAPKALRDWGMLRLSDNLMHEDLSQINIEEQSYS